MADPRVVIYTRPNVVVDPDLERCRNEIIACLNAEDNYMRSIAIMRNIHSSLRNGISEPRIREAIERQSWPVFPTGHVFILYENNIEVNLVKNPWQVQGAVIQSLGNIDLDGVVRNQSDTRHYVIDVFRAWRDMPVNERYGPEGHQAKQLALATCTKYAGIMRRSLMDYCGQGNRTQLQLETALDLAVWALTIHMYAAGLGRVFNYVHTNRHAVSKIIWTIARFELERQQPVPMTIGRYNNVLLRVAQRLNVTPRY